MSDANRPLAIGPAHLFMVPYCMSKWERDVINRHWDEHGFHLPLWFRLWVKVRSLAARFI